MAAPIGQEVEQIGTPNPKSMDVIVGREQGKTIYVRGGWLFGPACLMVSLGFVLCGLVLGKLDRRSEPAQSSSG